MENEGVPTGAGGDGPASGTASTDATSGWPVYDPTAPSTSDTVLQDTSRAPASDSAVQDTTSTSTPDVAVQDTTGGPAPAPPSAPDDPSVLDRVRSSLDGERSRRTLGWVLLGAWVVWIVALWVVQPRLVPAGFLTNELAARRPTSFAVVTVLEQTTRGPVSVDRTEVLPVTDDNRAAALDGSYSGPPVSIAYWVDSPVAALRVVDPNGLGSEVPGALVRELRAAGVPEAPPAKLWTGPPAHRTYTAGILLLLATTLLVIVGPRPRRGTRWFWFWLVGGPVSVGVAIYAVLELVRPVSEPAGTVHEPGVAGRWSGWLGLGIGFVLSLAGAVLTVALANLSPIWFPRI